jgi:hypothetical protein
MIPEDKPLSEKLTLYHQAIESEFSLNEPDTPVEIAYSKLNGLLNEATKALESILLSAESDAVRMSGIKLVFEYTLGKPGTQSSEDELTKLVQSLTDTTATTATTAKSDNPK